MDLSQSGSAIPNFPYGVQVHTYVDTVSLNFTPGTRHRVIVNECCRNNAIGNLTNPGGESAMLVADIRVPALWTGTNTSPQFLAMPIVYLPVGNSWTYNPLPFDVDGDSISWAIDTPYSSLAVYPLVDLNNVQGYTPPPAMASGPFSLNASTGQLSWTPSSVGNYVASFAITEYKNGVPTGVINRDMQYVVVSSNLAPVPQFSPVASTPYQWDSASGGAYIYYTPGQPLQFRLRGADAGSPQMTMECISPLFMRTPPPTFTTAPTGTGNQIEGTLAWTPPAGETATSTAVFRLRNGVFSKDFTLLLKKNPAPTAITTMPEEEEVALSVFPNPATAELNIRFRTEHAKDVTVQLVDLTGKRVATLFKGRLPKGQWTLRKSLDGAPGVYFVQLRGADEAIIRSEKVVVR